MISALTVLALVSAACALLPALTFFRNLGLFAVPPQPAPGARPAVSLLIPARNEEGSIAEALESALRSEGVELEVVVLDDHSEDRTAAIVEEWAARDPRVRLEPAPPLPAGWCGKPHACSVLAHHAKHDLLLFVDADVRLAPDGVARAVAFLESSGADLVSGFPFQETETFFERLLLPLIQFVLLGFLPFERMRRSRHPAYSVGCGQLFLAKRAGYAKSGGHAAIGRLIHDGLALPRAFRRVGLATDLFDATPVASCRMYRNAKEVWSGLAKNAVEALATPVKLPFATLFLLFGQVLPLGILAATWLLPATPTARVAALVATLASYLPRLVSVRRFRQPLDGALLHPLAIAVFLTIQWTALIRHLRGLPAAWKGRSYDLKIGAE